MPKSPKLYFLLRQHVQHNIAKVPGLAFFHFQNSKTADTKAEALKIVSVFVGLLPAEFFYFQKLQTHEKMLQLQKRKFMQSFTSIDLFESGVSLPNSKYIDLVVSTLQKVRFRAPYPLHSPATRTKCIEIVNQRVKKCFKHFETFTNRSEI